METATRTAASDHVARSTALVALAVAAAVVLGGGLAWACSVNANIPDGGLTPNHGPPGTDVRVEAREFNPGRVEIRWDSTTGPLLGTAMVEPQDEEGSFETTVTIPEQASHQVHTVVAVQRPYKAQATFEVTKPGTAPENNPSQGDPGTGGDGNNELSGDHDGQRNGSRSDGNTNGRSAANNEGENALSGGAADANGGSGDDSADSRSGGQPRNALTQGHEAGSPAAPSRGAPRQEVAVEGTNPSAESQGTPAVDGGPGSAQESSFEPTPGTDGDAASRRGGSAAAGATSATETPDDAAGGRPAADSSSEAGDAAPEERGGTDSEVDGSGRRAGSQEPREPSSRSAARDLWSGFASDDAPSLTPASGGAAAADATSEGLLLALAMMSVGTLGLLGAGAFALRRRSAQLRHSQATSRATR